MDIKILGCNIYISFSFIAFLTIVILTNKDYSLILASITAFLHEMGHILCMIKFNSAPQKIRLNLLEINIVDRKHLNRSYIQDILIMIAGPLFNIFFGIMFFIIYKLTSYHIFFMLCSQNFALAFFNLLPIEFLDGGQILSIILKLKFKPQKVDLIIFILSFIFVFFLIFVSTMLILKFKYNFSLLILSLWFLGILILKIKY